MPAPVGFPAMTGTNPTVNNFLQYIAQHVREGNPSVTAFGAPTGFGKTIDLSCMLAAIDKAYVLLGQRFTCQAAFNFVTSPHFYNGAFGPFVGLAMGNQTRAGPRNAQLTYLTDGLVQVFAAAGPASFLRLLHGATILVLDEAHDMSTRMELLVQGLPDIIRTLKSKHNIALQVVFLSATLDVSRLQRHFLNTVVEFNVPGGPRFPVEPKYLQPADGQSRPLTIIQLLHQITKEAKGEKIGVLVFVTGKDEGYNLLELIKEKLPRFRRCTFFIHGESSRSQHTQVINMPADKIIIATSIAQSSVTIKFIEYVIDPGLTKIPVMSYPVGETTLRIINDDKANKSQKGGRTGRTGPGKVHHLWTETKDAHIAAFSVSPSRLGGGFEYVLGLIQMYPDYYPTAEGLHGRVHNLFVEIPPAVVAHTVGLLYLIGAVEYTYPKGENRPPGVKLTQHGLLALNSSNASLRAGLFFGMTDYDDSLMLKVLMASLTVILSHQEDGKLIIGTFHDQDERKVYGDSRATYNEVVSLSCPGLDVPACGDIMADYVELFETRISPIDTYFKVNPRFDATMRSDALASFNNLYEQLPTTADKYQNPDDSYTLDYRMLMAYPDKIIKITSIKYEIKNDKYQVHWVQGQKMCANVSISMAKDVAFDFLPFATGKKFNWQPSEDLYFLYFHLAGSPGKYVASRIHRIDTEVFNDYNKNEWNGRYETDFKFDLNRFDPEKL